MIFNIRNQQDEPSFDFNGIALNSVNKHKHLGIIFSSDCKLTKHIDSLIKRTSKQLNVLRKLKYRLKREYLENIYFSFIRPILENSSEVWDNCGQVNSDRLDTLQLEAARIDTGLTGYTSLDSIYRETCWEKLSTRREVKKLCKFYKSNVCNSPEFLCDLIPPSVGETNSYNLRNSHNISKTTNILSISQQSFFSVDDQVMEFIRPENTSTFNF
jgi:hypothetical protein